MRSRTLVAGALVAFLAGGCGGSSGSVTDRPAAGTAPSTAAAPAAQDPSESARMVCAPEAQKDITEAIGVAADRVDPPTWVDHVYSCRYAYPTGSFELSVKDLSSQPDTQAYVDALGKRLGNTGNLDGLGQGAFTTPNGSVVVQKDWKVLLVDPTALPPRFGEPPITPANTALVVAKVILGCWTGA